MWGVGEWGLDREIEFRQRCLFTAPLSTVQNSTERRRTTNARSMPRRADQNCYSHAVNILTLPADENEVRNVPPSRQAEDKARLTREGKLLALAMQEKERRKHQDPCKTAKGPLRKTETPGAPNKVNKLDLSALRRPIEDVMRESPRTMPKRPQDVSMLLASVGGSRPPTACSRPPTACSRPVTARSRPASTARPGTAASTRPGTGISVLQREITQELENNDASGAFRASLEHELERLEERKLAARQAAQEEVEAEAEEAQEIAPLSRDEPPSRCSSRRSHRSSTITSCSKGRVVEARAAQSTIEIS